MKVKKILITAVIVLASLVVLAVISAGVGYALMLRDPGVRFLLSNTGFREPARFVKQEVFLDVNGKNVPAMLYRFPGHVSQKYFMLQHGLTPDAYKHPKIDRFARSICDATGMNVIIPMVEGSITGGSLRGAYDRMADIYIATARTYPGQYRAFGACIGANILLVALNRVPDEIYPEKIFMLGPFSDGKVLFAFYNKLLNPEDIDIMVKLAITLNMDHFSRQEKALISKAIAASKPGVTDRSEMKKILGDKLYNDIAIIKLHHDDFEAINPGSMFAKNRSRCKYFILHSKTDNIIPFYEGKNLADFMEKSGIDTNFLGTEILDHAENKTSVTGFLHELKYMVRFFNELFEGDVEI
ncbi:MAG TPA: hypothetical protein PK307_13440 [Spirochaetota bacterium]|nr:hypothetical protein [Spirochaetota bacterium]HOD15587.1 hypothetical protein [Spirochaetota bacterium]HPG49119.1 hypothetical protein [Spirochaetota bacterium]HPN11009.1 hypothetical protein [Spirochaetota bacterium]HQL83203.1 hypothetical protein [Spirochaetota bacterium]